MSFIVLTSLTSVMLRLCVAASGAVLEGRLIISTHFGQARLSRSCRASSTICTAGLGVTSGESSRFLTAERRHIEIAPGVPIASSRGH